MCLKKIMKNMETTVPVVDHGKDKTEWCGQGGGLIENSLLVCQIHRNVLCNIFVLLWGIAAKLHRHSVLHNCFVFETDTVLGHGSKFLRIESEKNSLRLRAQMS